MRVKKLEDLTPHEALYEKMAFSGTYMPVLDGVKVVYYKRYRQADIEALEGYKCPYVEYFTVFDKELYIKEKKEAKDKTIKIEKKTKVIEEHSMLNGTAAKIMLMRELVKNFGVGGQMSLGLEL